MNELARSFPAGVTWIIPVRHHAVRHRLDRRGGEDAVRGDGAGDAGGLPLPPELARHPDPGARRAGERSSGPSSGSLLLGFSINLLTLFALVLAIGIVVDDAIVVIENVERIMAEEKVAARVAADRAMGQVASALVAIVLSLCAVFIPVAFLGGITGTDVQAVRHHAGDRGGALRHRGAHADAGALRGAAQGQTQDDTAQSASSAGSTAGSTGSPSGYVRSVGGVLGRPRALARRASRVMLVLAVVLVRRVPSRVHSDRGQGLLRDGDPAARRRLAASAPTRWSSGSRAFLRKEPARGERGRPRWLGFDLLARRTRPTAPSCSCCSSRGTSGTRTDTARRDPWPGSTGSCSG